MTELLQRLLDPAYLYAVDPGPLGRWGVLYVSWVALLLLGTGAAIWWRRRFQHAAATVTACACGAGLILLGMRFLSPLLAMEEVSSPARFLLLDAWTARVWPLSATLIALCAPLVYGMSRLQLPAFLQCQVGALVGALRQDDPPLSLWQDAVLGAIHVVGFAWLWWRAGLPAWWAIPSVLLLSAPTLLVRPRRLRLETLTPLLPSYLASVVSLFLSQRLHVDLEAYQGYALPDPWSPWFNVPVLLAGGMAYTLVIQGRLITQGGHASLRRKLLPASLIIFTAVWLSSTVTIHHTRGVTASDPYCYVQMAIDLAETGLPLHDFSLAGLARELGLPTWPTVHIGYHPPVFESRAPTMWPIGWPLLMVPFYWLGGLDLLYLAAPLISACALVVTWFLANEALRDQPHPIRWGIAALTCFLVATSPEGSERILVPMADAASQLFTLLTLWLLLRGQRERSVIYGLLAGVGFGVTYLIRHPQLPLGVAALVTVLLSRQPVKRRVSMLVAFSMAAFTVAVPDLVYHRVVFGGWLHAESTEWFLISVRNVGQSLVGILQQGLLRREELGFVAPFALYGGWLLWRRHRRPALILVSGFLSVFLFHLFYAALRPRDLISILPLLYLCAAYGFVVTWQRAQRQRTLVAAVWLICCMTFLSARSYRTISMPWREDVITFGHINANQYQGLSALRSLTPQDAVIGSMLNGGAIELHAGRAAVHPAPWTEEELCLWTDTLLSRGRRFFILDDGEEMVQVLWRLERHYAVFPIQTLDLPYFAFGGGNLPRPAWLYEVRAAH